MASWGDVVRSEPEFADRARGLFDAHKHKILATLRKDGSPRVSGIEATFDDEQLWLGMMPGSLKALDILRDPRLALHSGSLDADEQNPHSWHGDAKLSGRGVPVDDPAVWQQLSGGEGDGHLFRVDLDEVVVVRVGDPADHLLIELWRPGQPLQQHRRT